MITTTQKDEILQTLFQHEGKGTLDGEAIAENVGVEPRHVIMLAQDLEKRGYIAYIGMAQYFFQVSFTLDGYDFYRNGGFAGLEKENLNRFESNLFQASSFGDNATIIVGSRNVQTVNNTVSVTKGDFVSLENALKERGVENADIRELELVIDNDDTNFNQQVIGRSVSEWIKKMVGKAVNSSWDISIAVAGSFLYDVIKHYYGFHI